MIKAHIYKEYEQEMHHKKEYIFINIIIMIVWCLILLILINYIDIFLLIHRILTLTNKEFLKICVDDDDNNDEMIMCWIFYLIL